MSNPTDRDVREAGPHDIDAVAAVLVDAFLNGDLADWLIPDPDERKRVYPDYFWMIAEHALEHGLVLTTTDRKGVALWYELDGAPVPSIERYDTRLGLVTGVHAPRFRRLDEAMARRHVTARHHYLAYLAVHPEWQGRGYGGRLLRHHLRQLDTRPTPAYLEATGTRNSALYLAHGFRQLPPPEPVDTGYGPKLYPMWREPAVSAHP